jgi:hypothetical protein
MDVLMLIPFVCPIMQICGYRIPGRVFNTFFRHLVIYARSFYICHLRVTKTMMFQHRDNYVYCVHLFLFVKTNNKGMMLIY